MTAEEILAIYTAGLPNWIQGDTILGDNIRGTNLPEVIDGCGGSDRIRAGGGNDFIIGGEEADVIYTGSGRDVISVTTDGDARFGDRVMDFTHGQDVILFNNDPRYPGGVDGFEDLVIRECAGDWVQITVPGTDYIMRVNVLGVGSLDASDFFFG